ncbi:cyclodeaminase [Pseudooceanicola sp. CBS1P-1]|uniref:Cyclodeaminase n=1 Tax=Pseudooceanicola albus TaxID=2692189 RepID=A0A6L7FZV2_9RHOB|nr:MULTISPECIES: cyclodeaminase [Pseudooceanicola]MBT9383780.1 cyclodeaminase [Pseudooceanicola endophyticus]MXN17634.1 cyclodeaminase [Pseudooceanicola albus]
MAHDIRILTESELRGAVTLDLPLIDAIEAGFAALAGGAVVMPPVLSMALPQVHGEVDVKTAYVPGLEGFAIKVSPGFFDNPKRGLPSLNGLMVLLSATTGQVRAVFLDNGYLTDLRTAAAGAVAARHLAPPVVETLGILGTGVQARLQARAAHLVRPFANCILWGRDFAKASRCAEDIAKSTGAICRVAANPAEVLAASQLVVTTTPATVPLITPEMLHPGLHITAMGSDQAGKAEVAGAAFAAMDMAVCDDVAQCEAFGELRGARAAGYAGQPASLGQVVTGTAPGRISDGQVTLCDLTGTGVQDTAIASFVIGCLGDAGTVIRN